MAGKPYIYERQTEYWTSRQIEEYYLDAGFNILVFPVSQLIEKVIPADFLFYDKERTKLFRFQYKTLYHNDFDFWKLNENQHYTLKKYDNWIYYCLSELKNVSDHRSALHFSRIKSIDFKFHDKLYLGGENKLHNYSRWGAFFQGLEKCSKGIRINSENELMKALINKDDEKNIAEFSQQLIDIFLSDFSSKNAIHFSPFLKNIQVTDNI